MENKMHLSVLHCIFYIYHTFAFRSDGQLSDSEKNMISNFMYRWVGKDKEKMNLIIQETLSWSKEHIKSINDQISTMLSMVDFLKSQKDFTIDRREYFLMDIRNIARSDGKFIDQQKKWHDMLANTLALDIRVSSASCEDIDVEIKKVEKRKIGFRR
ncbi:MAG: hypothetical protein CMP49_06620 [Flavobacteriales bacterium]|jgi:hypothetical protein|nr:hypothetical protein [Flavobacteriales bacterium]|tara:strand:+ start:109 stop:579 length:471 start_codon:yes stop_codon:yes gene_type:complete